MSLLRGSIGAAALGFGFETADASMVTGLLDMFVTMRKWEGAERCNSLMSNLLAWTRLKRWCRRSGRSKGAWPVEVQVLYSLLVRSRDPKASRLPSVQCPTTHVHVTPQPSSEVAEEMQNKLTLPNVTYKASYSLYTVSILLDGSLFCTCDAT